MVRKLCCNVGGVLIGADNPIVIQSMCNTATADVEASVAQSLEMHKAGAQLIRLTTQGLREVEALAEIRRRLEQVGVFVPLVADVHFSADVALAAAAGIAHKVRINPGNFSKDHSAAMEKFSQLLEVCREHGTALRIGLNHGSLGERITSLYGDTPEGMMRAVMEWLRICVERNFLNVVVSLKASNTKVMADAYRLLQKEMSSEFGFLFPLHLGVTEAGNGDSARIKSAVGIGTLLKEGIGDTIRVSLTENPAAELRPAAILANLGMRSRALLPSSEESKVEVAESNVDAADWEEFIIRSAYEAGPALLDCRADDVVVKGTIAGVEVTYEQSEYLRDELLQACRRRFTKPEYIACPSCGRTLYAIEEVLAAIKAKTAHLAGVKIAVMGCIVNGPGEMADADFGYVGEGRGKVTLYKGKTPVLRGVPQEEAVDRLLELIES